MHTLFTNSQSGKCSAQQLEDFVRRIQRTYMLDRPLRHGVERRVVQRMNLTMPLVVRPLDENMRPMGYQHQAITRDISQKGVGMVTTNPVGHRFVLLTFEPLHSEPFQVVGKVVHCNECGYYYQSGCEFIVE